MENVLRATYELMSDQPLFYIREALVILGSPNTRDAYDIQESIKKINQGYIIINMLSLNGLTYIFQEICKKTKGKYEVALNEHDFKQKFMVGGSLLGVHVTERANCRQSHEHAVYSVIPSAGLQRRSGSLFQHEPTNVVYWTYLES